MFVLKVKKNTKIKNVFSITPTLRPQLKNDLSISAAYLKASNSKAMIA